MENGQSDWCGRALVESEELDRVLIPGLPRERIRAFYEKAGGDEFESGKFFNPESSAALVANAFGYFLDRPQELPALPPGGPSSFRADSVALEARLRFPWRGGQHPWLDALISTASELIGVESKRYEPFRGKSKDKLSKAYERDVWGEQMRGYERVRDLLRKDQGRFQRLDAGQLMKHAFALRTEVHRSTESARAQPVLLYLYAEPSRWKNGEGNELKADDIQRHRDEVVAFAEIVKNDEVRFLSCTYVELLEGWKSDPREGVRAHAAALLDRFDVGQKRLGL